MNKNNVTSSHLHREIHEQPDVLQRLWESGHQQVAALAGALRKKQIKHVVIAARGTSDNAARYAKYLLGARNQLAVSLAAPSLFTIYQAPPDLRSALVLGISQSGESPDLLAVLDEASRQGALTAAITNHPESPMGSMVDYCLDLCAGEEKAIAATKTYTAELFVLGMLSAQLAGDRAMSDELASIPDAMRTVLTVETNVQAVVPRYRYVQYSVVIGRGFNYATAHEIALKLKELTYMVVEPYSSADFLHGPVAMVNEGFPIMVICPDGRLNAEMKTFFQILREKKAEIIGISNQPELLDLANVPLPLGRSVMEWVSPIITVVPGQLFAMYLAAERGYDVDRPRGLSKITHTH